MFEPSLSTEVQFLKGVGPRLAPGLNKAELYTVRDLLYRMPRRYEDRSSIPGIATVRSGQVATVHGTLKRIESRQLRGGRVMLRAYLSDGTGTICLTWFNQPWIKTQLEKSRGEIFAHGQVRDGTNCFEIAAPEWESVGEDEDPKEFGIIVPVYPLTEGLSQRTMRRAVRSALAGFLGKVEDPIPAWLLKQQGLKPLRWALQQVHAPEDETSRLEGRRRLVFDEFFYMQLRLAMKRAEIHHDFGISFPVQELIAGKKVAADEAPAEGTLFAKEERAAYAGEPLWEQIHRILPFELTGAQTRVIGEIWSDMASPHPMNRMVQGDVGSGKTAVALCAMLTAVRSGYQAALMAPTEILAEQHYMNIRRTLAPLGITVGLLIGKQGTKERRRSNHEVLTGAAQIVVGTHALIQEGVEFAKLGLVIVDEQHRFGVLQRKALLDKAHTNPDVLVMTATPIPRSLTMTRYGDLDLSVIDELPPGRKPIKTHWKRTGERNAVYQTVRNLIAEGRQAYFVCPLVSETEKMMAQAAEDLYYRLEGEFQGLSVGLLHGQMKPLEKEQVMERFRAGELHALVSTTVIEVGVDVPNATVMVIEDANRFGLSQLHQLRGRVGRGSVQSYCILVADAIGDDSYIRMTTMTQTNDGFRIAEKDLELRGPGMLTGTQQSGHSGLEIGDLLIDGLMLEVARRVAIEVIDKDPKLEAPQWRRVREQLGNQAVKSDALIVSVG